MNEIKDGYDTSIVGFRDAWEIMHKIVNEEVKR